MLRQTYYRSLGKEKQIDECVYERAVECNSYEVLRAACDQHRPFVCSILFIILLFFEFIPFQITIPVTQMQELLKHQTVTSIQHSVTKASVTQVIGQCFSHGLCSTVPVSMQRAASRSVRWVI